MNGSTDSPCASRLLAAKGAEVENFLLRKCSASESDQIPQRLQQAMQYSMLAGGKRLRPVLCLSAAAMCGADPEKVLPFACAIEMIHTYSLIHDDLPAMDDDDLRRGRPSCHKAFDEATAILAGDGLLTDAFALICSMSLEPGRLLTACATLANAAGSQGMVGGQCLDMEYTGQSSVELADLQRMHALKTGALIAAACECGAILAGAGTELQQKVRNYGLALGRAFQIVDDIKDLTCTTESLGKPAHSDVEMGKTTYPSIMGMKASCMAALAAAKEARDCLDGIENPEADFLRALAGMVAGPALSAAG